MKVLISLFLISLSSHSLANSKVVVTAEKISLDQENTISSVEVISEDEISKSGESSLANLIQRKSSIFVNSNGAYAKATSLFLRGADSSYTMIVIDGVEYNDRSSVGGAAILDHIDLSNVEKIEILKGAQSVLYGSDALAGVIKITTKSPEGKLGGKGSLSYGSYDNKRASFSTTSKGSLFDYSMGLSFQDVEGISSYNEKRTVGAERDGMNNLTATLRAKKELSKLDTLEFNIRGVKAESDFDASSGDKLDYIGRDSQVIAGLKYERRMGDYWVPELSVNYNKSDRLSNSFSLSRLVAETKKIELFNPFYINENITILNGLEYEDVEASIDRIDNKKNFYSYATFLDSHIDLGDFNFQGGVRWTKEKMYSDNIVWKSGLSYSLFENTQLKINASTGFKSPSLYQLYSTYGNRGLKPTKNTSYDFSYIQIISQTKLGITLFKDSYENVIDFDSVLNKYSNTFKASSKGIEFSIHSQVNRLSLDGSATIMRAVNKTTGSEGLYLARRPREKYFLGLGYLFNENVSFNIDYNYIGQRENSDFDAVVLGSYSLIDLKINYQIEEDHGISLKISNVLNKEYEQVSGFGTPDRSFLVRYNFRM